MTWSDLGISLKLSSIFLPIGIFNFFLLWVSQPKNKERKEITLSILHPLVHSYLPLSSPAQLRPETVLIFLSQPRPHSSARFFYYWSCPSKGHQRPPNWQIRKHQFSSYLTSLKYLTFDHASWNSLQAWFLWPVCTYFFSCLSNFSSGLFRGLFFSPCGCLPEFCLTSSSFHLPCIISLIGSKLLKSFSLDNSPELNSPLNFTAWITLRSSKLIQYVYTLDLFLLYYPSWWQLFSYKA